MLSKLHQIILYYIIFFFSLYILGICVSYWNGTWYSFIINIFNMYIQRNVLKCKREVIGESHRGTGHIRAPQKRTRQKKRRRMRTMQFCGLVISSLEVPGTLKLTSLHLKMDGWKLEYDCFLLDFGLFFSGELLVSRSVSKKAKLGCAQWWWATRWGLSTNQLRFFTPSLGEMIPMFFLIYVCKRVVAKIQKTNQLNFCWIFDGIISDADWIQLYTGWR